MENKEENQNNINQYLEETISFRELANRFGIVDLDTPQVYDITDGEYEILSYNHETNEEVWSPLLSFVVKQNADKHYRVGSLQGTKDHMIWHNGEYVTLENSGIAELVNEPIQVVDCEVENTHNYVAEGFINHNTTTPGGMALPYMCSTRIQITSTGQSHVKDKNDNIIGINVKAKTIKNKVAPPFRSVSFQIIFGKGVVEHEEVFDAFREHCAKASEPVMCGNKIVLVEGTGAWKTFQVSDAETGEIDIEVKCHKADFGTKVLDVPEFQEYVDALFTATFVTSQANIKNHPTFDDVDSDSYTETFQIAVDQAEQLLGERDSSPQLLND